MNEPMISVVMPVYNGEKYLKEAIDSILNQTFTNFEFIILNDGSTDNTEEIILSYDDSRIVYIKNKENLQIAKTLNKGIKLAKGRYIARMDADDICLSERFEKQVQFLEDNKKIGVCGTWLEIFGTSHDIWKMPISHEEIIMNMIFNSSLMHPTVFIRKNVLMNLEEIYLESSNKVEDYDLWSRLANNTKFANIPEVLLNYRVNNLSTERKSYKQVQQELSNKIRKIYLKNNHINYSQKEIELHNNLACYNYQYTKEFADNVKDWFVKILNENKKNKFVSEEVCEKVLLDKFYEIYNNLSRKVYIYPVFVGFLNELKFKYYKLRIKLFLKKFIK